MGQKNPFKWRHFGKKIILLNVRWYAFCAELLGFRRNDCGTRIKGRSKLRTTEIDKKCKPHLRPTDYSYRVDETYIKVKGEWKYLYRAVDSQGNTIEFMLSAKRNRKGAKRFFRKALRGFHTSKPRMINVDLNPAYPSAVEELKEERIIHEGRELRQNKYLNNIVEQDHRLIKRRGG